MKTIYQPTKEELIELGFEKHKLSVPYWSFFLPGSFQNIGYWQEHNEWRFNNDNFYPRSKQALLDFISNFSPNE